MQTQLCYWYANHNKFHWFHKFKMAPLPLSIIITIEVTNFSYQVFLLKSSYTKHILKQILICRWIIFLWQIETETIFICKHNRLDTLHVESIWYYQYALPYCKLYFLYFLPFFFLFYFTSGNYSVSFASNPSQITAHVGLYIEKWCVWNNDISIKK